MHPLLHRLSRVSAARSERVSTARRTSVALPKAHGSPPLLLHHSTSLVLSDAGTDQRSRVRVLQRPSSSVLCAITSRCPGASVSAGRGGTNEGVRGASDLVRGACCRVQSSPRDTGSVVAPTHGCCGTCHPRLLPVQRVRPLDARRIPTPRIGIRPTRRILARDTCVLCQRELPTGRSRIGDSYGGAHGPPAREGRRPIDNGHDGECAQGGQGGRCAAVPHRACRTPRHAPRRRSLVPCVGDFVHAAACRARHDVVMCNDHIPGRYNGEGREGPAAAAGIRDAALCIVSQGWPTRPHGERVVRRRRRKPECCHRPG